MKSSDELRHGQIVWAILKDRNGFRKRRPAIILTPTEEIDDSAPLVVVCITTTFGQPPPKHHVPLPWNADPRRVMTRLAQRSAAVVNWLDTVYPDEILEIKGETPQALLNEIQRQVNDLSPEENPE